MYLDLVRKQRGLPFIKRGMTVESLYYKKKGVITGANVNGNINIKLEGDKYSQNYHPLWQIRYFDENGNVIKEFKE